MPKRVGCECDKATLSCVVGLKSMVKKNAFEFFNQCHFAVDVHGVFRLAPAAVVGIHSPAEVRRV